jgi:hypothetical protein
MSSTSLLDSPIIVESIRQASDELLRRSQKRDYQSIPDTMLLSERTLSEWDTEEEDNAWANL